MPLSLWKAVGPRHLSTFFRIVDWALKPDRATVVITATSQPEDRWSEYQCVTMFHPLHQAGVVSDTIIGQTISRGTIIGLTHISPAPLPSR